jgi:hypothetical protein
MRIVSRCKRFTVRGGRSIGWMRLGGRSNVIDKYGKLVNGVSLDF